MRTLWKWLVCSWLHRRHQCRPVVWKTMDADMCREWHCTKCHPCGEGFQKAIDQLCKSWTPQETWFGGEGGDV